MTIKETHGGGGGGGSELFRSVGSPSDEMMWSTVNVSVFGSGRVFSFCWTTALVLFFLGFFHLLRSRSRIRSTLSIFRVMAPSSKISQLSSSPASIASTSNGGRIISDVDLKDLIFDLHPQPSSSEVWNELVTKQNNSVFYNAKCCKLENGSIKYLSTTKFLNCSTNLLKNFYMDNEYRVKWDTTVIDHQQLELNSIDMIEFGRTIKKFPLLSPREYVLAWRIWEGKNSDFYCFIKNCEHPLAPQRKGYVRVGFFRSGWSIKKVPSQGGDACEITMVHQEDAGLNPNMAKAAFTRGIWSYICKMDKAFRGYSSWVVTHPKPAISLDCIQFPLKPSREFVSFRTHSVLSTTTTTLNEREEFHTDSLRNFSYSGAVDYRAKMSFEASLAAETLQKNEESLIEETAADAIALAKAAAEMAKDAAQLVAQNPSLKHGNLDVSSESDILQKEMLRLIKMDFPVSPKSSGTAKTTAEEELLNQPSTVDEEISDSLESDFDLLESHHLKAKAVRSGRQTERRSRRACAAEKAATAGILVKSGPSSRKKRASVQEVDYSDPLRYLRGTTSSSKLLSVSEEVELSAAIQDLLKLEKLHGELEQRYGKEPTFTQWAAAAGVDQRTLRKRLNHGVICKDRMIKSNIRLVISIAKNYQGSGMNIQDLVQEGCRGLVKGAEKFDASKGFKFSTYAHWWIKQAVRKSLSDQSRTIRLPFHMVEATYRVKEARKKLYSKNGKYPNNEELADVTGLSMKRLAAVMLAPKPPISLDQKIGINQDMKPSDVIANPDAETSESLLMKQFMKHDLNKVLDTLNPRERQVVRWRFGLEDGRMKTLQEIGESMGVSRERVRQIESCAFRKLKNKKRTKCLQQYLLS